MNDEAVWILTASDRVMAILINLFALRFFVDLIICRHFYNERRKVNPVYYSDNPVADFLRHDAEQEKELKQLPVCDYCNDPIQDEFYYEINGDNICNECLDRFFKKEVEFG